MESNDGNAERQHRTWSGPSPTRQEGTTSDGPITIRGFQPPENDDGSALHISPQSLPHGFTHGIRRRSSLAERLGSIADAGGVNSLSNFAASWQRAANFFEVTPVRRPFALHPDDTSAENEAHVHEHEYRNGPSSLLRAALQHEQRHIPEESVDTDTESIFSQATHLHPTDDGVKQRLQERRSHLFDDPLIHIGPSLSSPFGASYGTIRGSMSHHSPPPRPRIFSGGAGSLYSPSISQAVPSDQEPLLVKVVEDDEGKFVNVVVGRSTLPQTVFNSCNVLLGVGVLALPLAIRYSGWLIGMTFFLASAVVTGYTARLLAKCLDVDGSLVTFADLAYVSFGRNARIAVGILFTLELLASCVALVIVFADSLNALVPSISVLNFKLICGILTIPLAFLPLSLLSFTSIAGILSCLAIVGATIVDGLVKENALGSLREPAKTYLFPANWNTLPLAFGLLMAPWGGHSVFPNIYRDMRHPYKYSKAVNVTYIFTYLVEAALAIAGYLMFGEHTRDEITSNIFRTKGYPRWLSIFMLTAISIVPLTKLPLNARPIISTVEILFGLDPRFVISASGDPESSSWLKSLSKIAIRVFTIVMFIAVAIVIPSFDRVMSLLGSLACFTICIVLPCAFHLKIFGKELGMRQRMFDWFLIISCSALAALGTAYSFVPKSALGISE